MPAKKDIGSFTLIDGTLRFVHNNGLIEVTIAREHGAYLATIKSHLISAREDPICPHVMNDSPKIKDEDPQKAIESALLKHFELFHPPRGMLRLVEVEEEMTKPK